MEVSSDDLLSKARSGDRDALGALMERCATDVRSALAGSIPGKWQSQLSIDDVLQQTYIDAFLGLARYLDSQSQGFVGWMITLARRNLIDAFRMLDAEKRGGNHQKVEFHACHESMAKLSEALGISSQTPSRVAARSEASHRVLDEFQRLPNVYREVIQRYDLEGHPVSIVAAQMRRSPGAIFMLRARAHERLAELMGSADRYFSDAP